ncbi:N-acetylglucosamine kinase [Kineococcus rhizosphaerae]|uniref:N-acetylglucosamine kinase-like BadF-type ATPase n=1 Tax=Kineococcus rhizosphaerae TaxID=559628 RepID=A0A2T0R367_9ACTN|nr:BadF/BadG/BcrA/BcrD ATPase family protein [Kineococcus rhizosphaerae]PRY14508.1 N-acetylglucosamine kinase-like BadF-type ATPase [Kineococcus rhizosphaerae]
MSYYLGMDGGGTKTAFVLVDAQGRIVAQDRQPTSYYFGGAGLEAVEEVLRTGVGNVTAGIDPGDVAHAFFAFPGYGEASADVAALDALPGRVLGHDRYVCGNDMVSGWAGSLGGHDGINVVAGTGSIAYGERAGVAHRAGGWSELFGDEGSAYWVAVQGLAAFSRMADGREPRTGLYDAVRTELDITEDLDAIGVVVDRWQGQRTRIAGLARTVTACAEAGDERALGIVRAAAAELLELVEATARALGHTAGEVVPVSYSGGLFEAPVVLAEFRAALAGTSYDLREPLHDPGLGSALYAMRRAGAEPVV